LFSPLRSAFRSFQRACSIKPLACLSAALLLAGCTTAPVSNAPGEETLPSVPSAAPAESTAAAPQPARASTYNAAQLAALRQIVQQQQRLDSVAAPLLISNAMLCRSYARNLIGFSAKNAYSYSDDYVAAAQALGFGDRLQVTGVLQGSGAEQAGVMVGDVLVAVEGQQLPQGRNAERDAAALLGPIVTRHASVTLDVIRNDQAVTLNVPLTLACGYSVELGNTDNVIAYSDGRRVLVSRGMLNFVHSDTELAYVLAKEIAQNALRYPIRLHMTATVGGIIDNLIRVTPDTTALSGTGGVMPMPKDLDIASDTVALYMLARAGYDVQGAHAFWARLADAYPASVPNGYTAIHPSTDARLDNIDRIVRDIQTKLAKRQPLFP